MKKNLLVYTIFGIFLVLSPSFRCMPDDDDNHHYRIRFVNWSEKSIYVDCSIFHPDTIPMLTSERDEILPGKINNSTLSTFTSWESVFGADLDDRNLNPIDTLMVFVFDAELLETNPSYVEEALLLRYDLSLKDLQRFNWTLSYPPTESMKDIKMWPRFEKK